MPYNYKPGSAVACNLALKPMSPSLKVEPFPMKRLGAIFLLTAACTCVRAELYGPSTVQGTRIGASVVIPLETTTETSSTTQVVQQAEPAQTVPMYVAKPDPAKSRPNYTVMGGLLGGIAGAVIGNNTSHDSDATWQGAAIGAVSGLILGGLAEKSAKAQEQAEASNYVTVQKQPETTTSKVTIINHYAAPAPRPMDSANSLFGR